MSFISWSIWVFETVPECAIFKLQIGVKLSLPFVVIGKKRGNKKNVANAGVIQLSALCLSH